MTLPERALCRYLDEGRPRVGLLIDGRVAPTDLASPLGGIVDGGIDPRLEAAIRRAGAATLDPKALRFLPPVEPRTMLYAGRNYEDHLAENPRPRQAEPVLFSKLVSSLIGHGDAIRVLPEQHVDYEGELAVVIGREARRVSAQSALDVVAGYTVANDVSDRKVQHVNNQITMGKGPDTFGPLGPWLVPRDAVGDGSGLRLRTWVNDELRQDGNTRDMIHDVVACLVAATRTVTLQPGDVVATGTPAGVGAYMDPPDFLQPGATVTVEIERIGRLVNVVEADRAD